MAYRNCRFLDKTGRTGSTIQLANGVFLLSAFFGVRLVYGGLLVRLVALYQEDLCHLILFSPMTFYSRLRR